MATMPRKRTAPAKRPRTPGPAPASTIGAGAFKNRCLALLDQVARTRRPITITKHGKPVATLIPAAPEEPEALFGDLGRKGWRIAPDVTDAQLFAPVPAAEWAENARELEALARAEAPP
jgi:prevent-host-death family protein